FSRRNTPLTPSTPELSRNDCVVGRTHTMPLYCLPSSQSTDTRPLPGNLLIKASSRLTAADVVHTRGASWPMTEISCRWMSVCVCPAGAPLMRGREMHSCTTGWAALLGHRVRLVLVQVVLLDRLGHFRCRNGA